MTEPSTIPPTDEPGIGTGPTTDRAGWAHALVLGAAFAAMGMIRYENWWAGAIDLGVFDQGIWLMAQGSAPEVTINGRNLFADHLSPIVLLFVPLYRVVATPHWLFAAQGLALGATVLPLRAIARELHVPAGLATATVLLGAPLASAAIFEFHPATLTAPFVAWTILAAIRGDRTQMSVAALLVLACRAELAWVLVGIAVVAPPEARRRLAVLAGVGLVAGFTIPAALGAEGTFTVHYGHLGATPAEALTHPWRVVSAILSADTVTKLSILFLPVAFAPFVRPRWAVAALVASLPVLLSQWPGTAMPWFHYWAPMYPIVAAGSLAAVAGLRFRPRVDPRLVVVMGGVAAMALMSPLSPRAPDVVGVRSLTDHRGDRADAAAQVRDGEPVAASNRILSHLMHRREAWLFPAPYAASTPVELAPEPDPAAAGRIAVLVLQGVDAVHATELGLIPSLTDAQLADETVIVVHRP